MKTSLKHISLTTLGTALAALLPLSAQAIQQVSIPGLATGSNLVGVVQGIVSVFLGLVALAAAIYIVLSGVKFITSGGDEGEAKKAKNGIIYAVIGLIVIGASILIVNLIIDAFGGGAPAGGDGGGGGGGGTMPISSDEPTEPDKPIAL